MTKTCQTCANYSNMGEEPGCMRRRTYATNESSEPPPWGFPTVYETDDGMWVMSLTRFPGDVCGKDRRHWTPKREFKVE